ncbi:sugar-binding transcriptional regulator [Paenibacillus wulumuqiensis]|uniref:sugar-binding transcriptional regulator n=1 Tax=Paenibacillus wulumuqiensis TaxID=1567107 RepID=UPI000619974B|nr:sugar-binding domain-containing protein [Paenibacillus wulumuqiensis]
MRKLLEIQEQLLPDLTEVLKKRYTILHQVMLTGLVGRRSLATSLNMTERVLRAETDLLKALGLLEIESTGMRISEAGRELLEELEPIMEELLGLSVLEDRIRDVYGLRQVVIVPGDSDTSASTKQNLGRAGAKALLSVIRENDIVAVTGGFTLAEVAEQLSPTFPAPLKDAWFVPARGGLGENMEYQANSIVSTMAKRVGAQYRLLHVPDLLRRDAYELLYQDQNVREIVDFIRRARIIIHGIGDAMEMVRRRRLDPQTVEEIRSAGAVAESFGHYFNEEGQTVHHMLTLGLQLEDIANAEVVIGIAGGRSKAKSIHAVLKFGQEDILVIDEAAAREIVKEL